MLMVSVQAAAWPEQGREVFQCVLSVTRYAQNEKKGVPPPELPSLIPAEELLPFSPKLTAT